MYARFITEMLVIEKVSEKKNHAGVKLERIIIIFFIIRMFSCTGVMLVV